MIKQKRRPQSSYQMRSKNSNNNINNISQNNNLMKNNVSSKIYPQIIKLMLILMK